MRIDALTGIRGVAAMSVMLYHIPQQAVFAAFDFTLFDRAYLCVDLFFVLSGFVLAIGYRDIIAELPTAAGYAAFLRHRLARVFPLHFVVTLAFVARAMVDMSGDGARPSHADIVANLLMVQSWGLGTTALAGNSWSVSTEWVAYLLFPLIALGARSRWWIVLAAGAVALLAGVASSGIGVEGPMDVVQRTSLLPVLRCMGGFTLGLLAQRIAERAAVRQMLSEDGAFAAVCGTIALALLVPDGDLIVVLLLPMLILCCYYQGRAVRMLLANRVSLWLGIISYSLYLWHPLFRDIAARVLHMLHGRGITALDLPVYLLLIVGTIVACDLSYRMIETRGRRLILWRTRGDGPAIGATEATG